MLFPGEELHAGFTGGFVVFNSATKEVLETANNQKPGVASYYENGNGGYDQDEEYYYFSYENSIPEYNYVVPQNTEGYNGYRFSNTINTQEDGVAERKYCTFYGMKNKSPAAYPVYFLYLEEIPITYTVKFDCNGGSGTMADQTFAYNITQNLTANGYTNSGYNFTGWNTKADGTGDSYGDMATVSNLSQTQDEVITLYAQWEKIVVDEGISSGTGTPEPTPEPEVEEPEPEVEEPEPEVVESEPETPVYPVYSTPPKTGDFSNTQLMLALMLFASYIVLILRRKIHW